MQRLVDQTVASHWLKDQNDTKKKNEEDDGQSKTTLINVSARR